MWPNTDMGATQPGRLILWDIDLKILIKTYMKFYVLKLKKIQILKLSKSYKTEYPLIFEKKFVLNAIHKLEHLKIWGSFEL